MRQIFYMALIVLLGGVLAGCATPVIDSALSREQALAGTMAPDDVQRQLVLLEVQYYAFDGALHQGQLVVHRDAQEDVEQVFRAIRATRFPVAKCVPIVHYNWSDDASMADNNTSGFNYRMIAGTTRLSNHSFGRAIDINPVQNPAVYADGTTAPAGAVYDPQASGTLAREGEVVQEFLRRGWRWGGAYTSFKDYQHFELLQDADSGP